MFRIIIYKPLSKVLQFVDMLLIYIYIVLIGVKAPSAVIKEHTVTIIAAHNIHFYCKPV
jgi:hypothetical protein